jgi:hypothetical protein
LDGEELPTITSKEDKKESTETIPIINQSETSDLDWAKSIEVKEETKLI